MEKTSFLQYPASLVAKQAKYVSHVRTISSCMLVN